MTIFRTYTWTVRLSVRLVSRPVPELSGNARPSGWFKVHGFGCNLSLSGLILCSKLCAWCYTFVYLYLPAARPSWSPGNSPVLVSRWPARRSALNWQCQCLHWMEVVYMYAEWETIWQWTVRRVRNHLAMNRASVVLITRLPIVWKVHWITVAIIIFSSPMCFVWGIPICFSPQNSCFRHLMAAQSQNGVRGGATDFV